MSNARYISFKQWYGQKACLAEPGPPNICCAMPPSLQKDQYTLTEQSNILLKQSIYIICYANNSHSCNVILSLTKRIIGGAMGIK